MPDATCPSRLPDSVPPDRVRTAILDTIAAGALDYERTRHLPRLIAVTAEEIADLGPAGRRSILARLARSLRAERNRGRAGHWTYDLNRHIGLAQAYRAERRALLLLKRDGPRQVSPPRPVPAKQ